MATERQLQANRRNAARSTGPRTDEGKARSRLNATTHGLSGDPGDPCASRSPEFLERRARWAAERRPVGEAANFALDRAVAASFRIERCERAVEDLADDLGRRARLCWHEDRAVEAAKVFARLARDPALASRQLATTLAGVGLLIDAWLGLASAWREGDWSDEGRSTALDLLGVGRDLRSGRTALDAPEGVDSAAHGLEVASGELDRLEALRDEALVPLDESERRRAISGSSALLTKEAKLLLRYERDAWRHYDAAMEEAHSPPPVAAEPAPAPAPTPAPMATTTRPAVVPPAAPAMAVTAPVRPAAPRDETKPISTVTDRTGRPDRTAPVGLAGAVAGP